VGGKKGDLISRLKEHKDAKNRKMQ
jgi:hypothetical protein